MAQLPKHSGGRVSGKARREVGRTKENPEGAHGKWRTWGSRKPLPLPRSNDQSYFLSVILVSKRIVHRKKATNSIHNSNNQTSAFLEDNHHTLVYSTEALCVFAILSH